MSRVRSPSPAPIPKRFQYTRLVGCIARLRLVRGAFRRRRVRTVCESVGSFPLIQHAFESERCALHVSARRRDVGVPEEVPNVVHLGARLDHENTLRSRDRIRFVPHSPPFLPGRLFPAACCCRRHVRTASTSARVMASIGFVASVTVAPFAPGISACRRTAMWISISRLPSGPRVEMRTCRLRYSSQTSPNVSRVSTRSGLSADVADVFRFPTHRRSQRRKTSSARRFRWSARVVAR